VCIAATSEAGTSDWDVRLVGMDGSLLEPASRPPTAPVAGLLQVHRDSRWGWVWADSHAELARVACQQLGYAGGGQWAASAASAGLDGSWSGGQLMVWLQQQYASCPTSPPASNVSACFGSTWPTDPVLSEPSQFSVPLVCFPPGEALVQWLICCHLFSHACASMADMFLFFSYVCAAA
jgi:hypothetical protein